MPSTRWRQAPLLALLSYSINTLAQITTDPEIFIDNATAVSYPQGEITVHEVTVANNSHGFSPNSITATPGDIISFKFWPGGHSVIHSEYGYPCVPYEDLHDGQGGFFSGTMNATSDYFPTWNLTVNDTSPTFFYCGAPGSCVGHAMLGAINPTADTPLLNQMALAKEADYQLLPGQALPEGARASMSSLAQTATVTVTASQTSTPATTTSAAAATTSAAAAASSGGSSLSAGAIAGIVIGGVAVLALAAGLFYFFGRSKTLKEQVQQAREDGYNQSRHASMMPPSYAPTWGPGHGDDGFKPTSEVEGSVVGTPGGPNRVGSPEMRESTFSGRGSYRFSEMSEPGLGVSYPFPPPVQSPPQELDARGARSPT